MKGRRRRHCPDGIAAAAIVAVVVRDSWVPTLVALRLTQEQDDIEQIETLSVASSPYWLLPLPLPPESSSSLRSPVVAQRYDDESRRSTSPRYYCSSRKVVVETTPMLGKCLSMARMTTRTSSAARDRGVACRHLSLMVSSMARRSTLMDAAVVAEGIVVVAGDDADGDFVAENTILEAHHLGMLPLMLQASDC